MKLRINKACDLSSISVLPPRRSNGMSSGNEVPNLGKSQGSQFRSQSQQPFSQEMSLSQFSQSSFEENLMSEQRIGSQEKENPSKRIPPLSHIASGREESQLQLSRASNNTLRRWNSASVPDNRCQVNEEVEHRFRLIEGSLNRLGMILDSVQGDVMQVNRGVKEVSLETDGIRQKIILLDNSMQKILKGEEDIKAFIDSSLRCISDQMIKSSNSDNMNEINSTLSALPKQIEESLLKLQDEVCRAFTKEMEVVLSDMKTLNKKHPDPMQPPENRSCMNNKPSMEGQIPAAEVPVEPLMGYKRRAQVSKVEGKNAKPLKPKLTDSKHSIAPKQKEILPRAQEQNFRVIIDSDEESNEVVSCLIVKNETVTEKESYLMEEAKEETIRILRRARKRKRRQMNHVIVV